MFIIIIGTVLLKQILKENIVQLHATVPKYCCQFRLVLLWKLFLKMEKYLIPKNTVMEEYASSILRLFFLIVCLFVSSHGTKDFH